jgi:protease-4
MAAIAPTNPPAAPAAAVPTQTIVVYTHSSLSRLFGWLGWAGFAVCALLLVSAWTIFADYFDTTGGISEKYVQGAKLGDDKVAIISIEGVIIEGDGFVKRQIDRVRKDESVKAVVVRVDSPGGTVTGSDYILHHLKELKKERDFPIVVSMGGMAASGGYYVSMAVGDEKDVIFAEPTCETGSIGVILPHYDLSGLLEWAKVKDDSIMSHERKQMLSPTREMKPEHREIVQAHINSMFERFKSIIKEGRPVFQKDGDALEQLATGEIFTADQALKHGLIDKIGFLEAAIDRAIELAKLDKKETRVIRYNRPSTLLDGLGLPTAQQTASSLDLPQLLDLTAPRAWYLSTSLPAAVTGRRAD